MLGLYTAISLFLENWDVEQCPYPEDEVHVTSQYDHTMDTHISDEPSPPEALVVEPSAESEPPAPSEPTVPPEVSSEMDNAANLEVDPELLKALGTFDEETAEWGEPIVEHIAMRLKPLLISGLKKEEKEILLKKYQFPKNVTLAKAPTLNAEVSAMLSEPSRNRDKRLYSKQNQLGGVLTAVTKAMSSLLCKDPKITDILIMLSDASKLLADSHYLETDTRRSLITPLVDKELIETFKDRKRDVYLFGDNLGELVKNSRGIKRTGQLIQASTSNNLNHKGPSSRGRPQRNFANRGGGQQRPYRRQGTYGPPPAPPRRQQQAQFMPAPQRRRPPPPSSVSRPAPAANATGTHP